MRKFGAGLGWKTLSRFALIGAIGGGTAACSSDASRLGDPFVNPFSSLMGEPSATGSLGADEAVDTAPPAIRTPRIQSQALGAPVAPMSPRSVPSRMAAGEAAGTVGGMNPDAGRMTPRIAPAAPQPKLQFGKGPKGIEPKPEKTADRKPDLKKAEAEAAKTRTRPGQKAVDEKHAKSDPKADARKAEAAKKAESEAKLAKTEAAKKVAEAKAAEAAARASAKETKQAEKPAPTRVASADPVAPVASNDSFRWPAKGRVINGYGSSGNEGINIAVPEGTPVKAAEDGTVAYAGSDVKGYGKLVLVRHTNGYVSAYAHNGELDVKPGEKVKRGQTIAKSGATGNVTSPQLHFEIRKGATPVDPIPHLASN